MTTLEENLTKCIEYVSADHSWRTGIPENYVLVYGTVNTNTNFKYIHQNTFYICN